MTIKERQVIRQKILQIAYDFYFSDEKVLQIDRAFDLNIEREKEKYYAIKYLLEKGYLRKSEEISCTGAKITIAITALGIDEIEKIFI